MTKDSQYLYPILTLKPKLKLKPQMRRAQTLIHLLLLWLLLTAFAFQCHTKVQATRSVDFKLRPAKPGSRQTNGQIFTAWVEGKKNHKRPSGPNPVGNDRPPTRP
ncbi:CLAVATA3/ESR (CLE)-related protein 46 [Camellia sinensis]|uniref:CLAVATA3/ESR (CLE)-related protein 46 n=1 Tax=Camellia sinensis TaxID=4442 RepID=UPI0010357E37|nr:CLAVATA3/ESR (CLE)-related protein 46 [Camellia sinensis]